MTVICTNSPVQLIMLQCLGDRLGKRVPEPETRFQDTLCRTCAYSEVRWAEPEGLDRPHSHDHR